MEFQPFIAPLTELLDIYRHEQKARKNQEKKDKTADSEEQDKSWEEENNDAGGTE
ncbi:frizzled-2 [Platysternon megacephalum]|uniref:Frizzled-2 n=1 Tax=Platysternon megacephalum TaxID=55544 RepID=A0A4D9E1J8_9SAUR|nr:frizzled-2 [Platysternon megacephalum]